MRKLVKVVAGLVGLLVVLVVALLLLLQTSAVSNRVKDLVVPKVSAALGRDVAVKDARLHLFPPKVALDGTTVAGRPGEPPLVDVESFEVGLGFWPLVTSLGKDVRVTEVKLVRPSLNLVRAKDGSWNYEGLGGDQKEPPKQADTTPSDRSYVVEKASLQDGAVKLVDHASGDQATVALSKIDFEASNVGLGQPLKAKLSAAIAGAEKNFEADLESPKLPETPTALREGKYPELTGSIALKALDLAKLRGFMPPKVTGMMTGGRVDAQMKLATQDGKYHVDGDGKLSQLKLRGDPAQGSFELHAVADPVKGALQAAIDKLAVKGPGVDLGGSITLSKASPTKVRFDIKGPLLDLGQVMGLLPPSEQKKDDTGPMLTPEMRKSVEALDVAGTIAIDKVQRGGLVATNFKSQAALDQGAFLLKEAGADFFAGHLDASGTKVDLSEADPKWNLKAKLASVDMQKALTSLAGAAPIAGKITGGLDLNGAGVDWNAIQKALTGNGAISLQEGVLTTTDLGDKVLGALSQGLKTLGKGGVAGALGGAEGGKTTLRDLAAQFSVKDGAMSLAKPLTFKAPFGEAQLGGKIGLGGLLALGGTVKVPKDVLAKVAGGLPLPASLDVPLGLGGTLTQPIVNVNAQEAVSGLVKGAAQQQVNAAKDRALREGRRGAQDLLKGLGIGK